MTNLVIYNHGKDSVPWGEKALALAEVAKACGYAFISLDYRPVNDPERRVEQLLAADKGEYGKLVLVGSSMGGYVSAAAADVLKPQALFLLAPAFFLPGYPRTEFQTGGARIEVMHGWRDDVVPPENTWRFCQNQGAVLHMVDSDHRLLSALPEMTEWFERLLRHC